MKRRVILLLLLLVAGAIVNVAVAWTCSNRWEVPSYSNEPSEIARALWSTRRPADFPATTHFTTHRASFGLAETDTGSMNIPEKKSFGLYWRRAGWPLKALSGGQWATSGASGRESLVLMDATRLGREQRLNAQTVPIFPLRPIWPGFAINTVFYAAILWLLFAAPFALRRRRRIKRGLCPKCAYPVGTNKRCTECGARHEVKPRSAAS